jgi:hypothetical protein
MSPRHRQLPPPHPHAALHIAPICHFIYHLTDKFFCGCPAHPNHPVRDTGNSTLADLHRQYNTVQYDTIQYSTIQYIHKRPKHPLLWPLIKPLQCFSIVTVFHCSTYRNIIKYTLYQVYIVSSIYCIKHILYQVYTVSSIHCIKYILYQVYTVSSIHCIKYILYQVYTVSSIYCIKYILYQVYTVSSIYCIKYILYHSPAGDKSDLSDKLVLGTIFNPMYTNDFLCNKSFKKN